MRNNGIFLRVVSGIFEQLASYAVAAHMRHLHYIAKLRAT
jgi:hypothetical protein